MLAQGIVAVSKLLPRQRVTSANDVLPEGGRVRRAARRRRRRCVREGRTFSTAEVRISQDAKLRSVGLYFLDSGAPTVDRRPGRRCPTSADRLDAVPYDMRVTGRELRIVERRLPTRPRPRRSPGDQRVDPVQGRAVRAVPPRRAARAADDALDHRRRDAPPPGLRRGHGPRHALDGDHGREHGVPRRHRRDAVAPLLQPRRPRGQRARARAKGTSSARTDAWSRRTPCTRWCATSCRDPRRWGTTRPPPCDEEPT